MKRIPLTIAAALIATSALAQQYMPLPPGTVMGNVTTRTNPGNAVTMPQLAAALQKNGLIAAQSVSGDCVMTILGIITCTQAAGNFQVIGNLTVGGSIIDGNGILFTNIAAPATPAAGATRGYVDSATKTFSAKNDAGTVSNTVVASLAVANQFMTGISSAGIITRAQPAVTDISGFGAGCATFLGAPSSANLRGCLTDESGTGVSYFQGGDIGTPSAGVGTNLTGTAAGLTAGTATNAVNSAITNDTATNATMFPAWVTANTGNLPMKVTSTKLTFNPSTGILSSTSFTGAGTGITGLPLSTGVTGTLPVANGGTGDTGTAWTTYTPSPACGTATFTVNGSKSKTMGKTTWVQFDATITAIGTCASVLTFNLPITANSSGGLSGREMVAVGNGTTCGFLPAATAATCSHAQVATVFTVNERIIVSGVYENQ